MYHIIALMGKAGSGKDTILHGLMEFLPDAHEIISCTTRPIREGEAEGVNYFYLTPERFGIKVLNGEMLECSEFNDWFYGTSYESLRSGCLNIGVFNPTGIESLMQVPNIDLTVFYITASDKTRLLRQLNRENNPDVKEIIRRFRADEIDFEDLSDINYIEIDNDKDIAKAIDQVLAQIG